MKCLKCGGQAFDYNADKWHCLQCGRTSATAPEAGPQRPAPVPEEPIAYEWDPQQATPPVPRIVKWGQHDPDHFRSAYAANYKAILALNEQLQLDKGREFPAFLTAGLVSIAACAGVVWLWWMAVQQPGFIWIHIAIGVALGYWVLARWRRWRLIRQRGTATRLQLWKSMQSNARLALQQQENLNLGNSLCCPYCAAVCEFTPADAPPPAGLKCCLSCGRHFHTQGGCTYPVRFRLVNGAVAGPAAAKPQRN